MTRQISWLYATVMFCLLSVVCGLLVAGLALPPVLAACLVTKQAADASVDFGVELSAPAPAGRSEMVMADGTHLAWFFHLNREPVALPSVSPWMRKAQLAVENHHFYDQGAIDPIGLARATLGNATSQGQAGGGSSITQQYVKMLLIERALLTGDNDAVAAAQERTLTRKVRELRYAIQLEKKLTKDQILGGYLNLAYYGDGTYGVEAAAQHYFGTSAAKLTIAQAALLAGIVKNPTAYNPATSPSAALQRRNTVLQRMLETGMITTQQFTAAKKSGFDRSRIVPIASGCQHSRYPFLCDAARRQALHTPSLGSSPTQRQNTLNRGGLTIKITVNPNTQNDVQDAISRHVAPTDPAIAVSSLVQPGTGRVLAMTQSRPQMNAKQGGTWYNHAMPTRDGGAEGYQPGSTFKALTIAAALERGFSAGTSYDSPASLKLDGMSFESCHGPFTFHGTHTVWNLAHQKFGRITMAKAAQKSVNSYFLKLQSDTGLCAIAQMADRLGINRADGQRLADHDDQIATLTLGPIEVAPLSVANAYATLAAGGIRCDTTFIDTITRSGENLTSPATNCHRVLDERTAQQTTAILRSVMTKGSGDRAQLPGVPLQAGKTGTTDDNQAVWFAGYTPNLAGASMIAIDKRHGWWDSRNFKTLKNIHLPSSGTWLDGTGGQVGQRLWKPAMQAHLRRE